MKQSRVLPALGALLILGVVINACAGGGGVPKDAVATVDGEPITKQSLDRWLAVVAYAGGRPAAAIPKPPDYANCVTHKRSAAPAPGKGEAKPTDAQLTEQCKQEYEALRDQALGQLITLNWLEGEAADRGISVSDDEVEKSFTQQKTQSFPEDADYQAFLKASGQTEDDVLQRVRYDLLSSKIREQVTKGDDRVTEKQITDYYDANKARFVQPDRRDVLVVMTETKAEANKAKAALASGRSWKAVANEYSIDAASKAEGGVMRDVLKGQQDKALDEAIFSATKGELGGPVKTRLGYYVFTVTTIERASRQTFEQVQPTIKELLIAERQQKALEDFTESFRRKWRERTECSDGFLTPDCNNGPDATPTPAQPTTEARSG
jgi:foldase protein PrsA